MFNTLFHIPAYNLLGFVADENVCKIFFFYLEFQEDNKNNNLNFVIVFTTVS